MISQKGMVSLGLVVALNLLLQFFLQWYVTISFGVGIATDAFFGSLVVPQFILLVLGSSLTMVLIPLFSKETAHSSQEYWSYFSLIGILFFLIGLLLYATCPWWIGLIVPGLKAANQTLIINLSRIQLVSMLFSALLSVLWSAHTARQNFYLIEWTSIAASLIAFVLLVPGIKMFGIYAAAWTNVLRVFLQVLFLMKIMLPFAAPQLTAIKIRAIQKKVQPLITGNIYYKTDILIDRHLTSQGAPGQLTLFVFAQQIYALGNSILNKVLVNTMIPLLSKYFHQKELQQFKKLFVQRLFLSFLTTILISIAVLLFGKYLLYLVFAHQNFEVESVELLWWYLVLLFGYWIGSLVGNVTSGTFYSVDDTKTPTIIGAVVFTLYLPIKIISYHYFAIKGLALSISGYYLVSCLVQLVYLRRLARRSGL